MNDSQQNQNLSKTMKNTQISQENSRLKSENSKSIEKSNYQREITKSKENSNVFNDKQSNKDKSNENINVFNEKSSIFNENSNILTEKTNFSNQNSRKVKISLENPNNSLKSTTQTPDFQQFIEPKGFPLLQTNKENYFSQFNSKNSELIKERLKTTVFSNKKASKYSKSGLLHSICLSTMEEKDNFRNNIENMNFSYFLCRKIKEKSPGNYSFRNSILFFTKNTIICMNFEKNLMKIAEKASQKLKTRKSLDSDLFQSKSFKIKAFYPMKTLFKISSKKINSSILSFYLRMPSYEKVQGEMKEYGGFLEKGDFFKLNKENSEMIERVFQDWHLKSEVFFI